MAKKTDSFINARLSENLRKLHVSFGDTVRVIDSPITKKLRISGLVGSVFGETTPSVSGVEVFGELRSDAAINVFFEDLNEGYWLAPDLVEFVNHGVGQTVTLEGVDKKWVRAESGDWIEHDLSPDRLPPDRAPWWKFW